MIESAPNAALSRKAKTQIKPMKQLLQDMRAAKPKLADVPVPTPGPGQALVRTEVSLLSAGTERTLVEFAGKSLLGKARSRPDLLQQAISKARREGWRKTLDASLNRLSEPMPLGYSSAGEIMALGEGVREFKVGQRVACAGGGYAVHAEYALVPSNLLARLPKEVEAEAAAFATLGAIALHGFRLGEAQLGARVAVIGLGLLGQLAASIAAAAGCQVLGIDLDESRVRLARKRGQSAALREGVEAKARRFTEKQGFDAVLICADTESSDPVQLAGEIARERAQIVALGATGLEVDRRLYYAKELSLSVSRSYGPGRYDPGYEEAGLDYPIAYVRWTEGRNLQAFVDLLAKGQMEVDSLISHRFPIDEGPKAYELISSAKPFMGVLITYPEARGKRPKRVEFKAPAPLNKDKVRLGLIGAGLFARNTMLPAIKGLPGLELAGIASSSGRSAADLADKFGFAYAASDPDELIKDKGLDAIAILTRHNLHAEQSLAALQAGKAVFCEKPPALNEKELAAIEKQLAKKGSPLYTVGYNRRFAPLAMEMKAFLAQASAPLTAHYRINAGELPKEHWLRDPAQGGGRILGEVCHFVDFLSWLAEAEPVTVFAQSLPHQGGSEEDSLLIQLGFADGSLASISYLANGDRALPKEFVEVYRGGLVAQLDDFRALNLTQDGRRQHSRKAQDKGHRALWAAFVESLGGGGATPIPYGEIMRVSRATFGVEESLRTGEVSRL